jgi:hypothetical protein
MTDEELIVRFSTTMTTLFRDMLETAMDGHPAQALLLPAPVEVLVASAEPTLQSLAELMVRGVDSAFYKVRREKMRGLAGKPEFATFLAAIQAQYQNAMTPPGFPSGVMPPWPLAEEEEDA